MCVCMHMSITTTTIIIIRVARRQNLHYTIYLLYSKKLLCSLCVLLRSYVAKTGVCADQTKVVYKASQNFWIISHIMHAYLCMHKWYEFLGKCLTKRYETYTVAEAAAGFRVDNSCYTRSFDVFKMYECTNIWTDKR